MKNYTLPLSLLIAVLALPACTTTDEYGNKRRLTDTEKGAIAGATLGVLAGRNTSSTKKRVLYGIVGGVAGAAVGNYMDSQKKDLEANLQSEIERGDVIVERLPDNLLMVTMSSETSFDINSTVIKPGFKSTLGKIAKVVNKYGKTHLTLVGHTDNTGSKSYNQRLSEQRAAAIQDHLGSLQVIPQRMTTLGMGEDQPRTSNANALGRQQNRRVEIIIEPLIEQ
ncbi:MAG: OmpA family protein [Gammaproteobacteria bacterium]